MKDFAFIEGFTEKVLKDHELFTAPVDLFALTKSLGIRVDEQALELGISGMAVVRGNTKIVSINQNQHEHRKRFTIGHELGHILLDDGLSLSVDKKIYYRNGKTDWRELRANYFAASLLMPKKLLQEYFYEFNGELAFGDEEIAQVAGDFNVSTQAMCIRLSTLGFI